MSHTMALVCNYYFKNLGNFPNYNLLINNFDNYSSSNLIICDDWSKKNDIFNLISETMSELKIAIGVPEP